MMKNILNIVIIIPKILISIFSKAKDICNPLFYSSKRRILEVQNGDISFNSTRSAIFVVYRKQGVPFYLKNILKQLQIFEVNCWIAINHDASPDLIQFLKENSFKVIVRKNFGRDFGAYKDVLSCMDMKIISRLLILNDSMYYFSKGLDTLFKTLVDTTDNLVSLTNNFDKYWHAQSYLISMSHKIIQSKEFADFWESYKPYNWRHHVIRQGEIEFSKKVLSKFRDNSLPLYNQFSLSHLIQSNSTTEIDARISYFLPEFASKSLVQKTNKIEKIINYVDTLAILEHINPSHSIVFISSWAKGFCVLKKDIVYRGSFSTTRVIFALNMLGMDADEIKEAISEMELKGSVLRLGILDRLMANLGAI